MAPVQAGHHHGQPCVLVWQALPREPGVPMGGERLSRESSLAPSSSPPLFQPPLQALLSPSARQDPWTPSAAPRLPQSQEEPHHAHSSGLPGSNRPELWVVQGSSRAPSLVPNACRDGGHWVSLPWSGPRAAAAALRETTGSQAAGAALPAQGRLLSFTLYQLLGCGPWNQQSQCPVMGSQGQLSICPALKA